MSTGLYAIDIAMPVYYENSSEIIGILRATVDVTSLKDSLLAGAFGRTGNVYLVFPDKQFLHGDMDNEVLQLAPESAHWLSSLQESFGAFQYEGKPSLISKKLVSANSANDREVIESLGWYVVTHQDSEEALKPAAILVRTVVLTSLAVLLLASALAFYLGRLLTRF